ncbi:hypothetical protein P9848_12435, partial [Geobacillus stearothermophilus]|nr:hypothetical protein [Geobacillus stearothermophilus]
MQEHFHFTTDPAKLQKQYAAIFCFVSAQLSLIQMYLHRRNRHLVKQEDEVVMAVHLLGKLLGFSSERAWHRLTSTTGITRFYRYRPIVTQRRDG